MKDLNLINRLETIKVIENKTDMISSLNDLISNYSNGRDTKQHRQFWKFAQNVAENTDDDDWNTAEKVVNQCKIELRFIDSFFFYVNPNKPDTQNIQLQFKSISFEKCSQVNFDVFFDGAIKIMALKLGITTQELLRG